MSRLSSPAKLCLFPLLILLFAFGVAASESDEALSSEVPAPALEPAPADTPETAEELIDETEAAKTVPAAGRTWQFYSRENCYDMFGQSCYQSYFPDPFCPSNTPQGLSCSYPDSTCWVIISAHWADEYHCNP